MWRYTVFGMLELFNEQIKKNCPICTKEINEKKEDVRTNIFAYNIKNAIICGLCMKEFDNFINSEKAPKVLKCGETFCFQCIKKKL